MSLHRHVGAFLAQEGGDSVDSGGVIQHHTCQIRTDVVSEDAMDEILIPVEQHRRRSGFSCFLNRLPLTQQRLEIIDELVFTDSLCFRAHQQACTRRFHQHPESSEAISLPLRTDATGDVHALATGLQHQITTWQSQISSEARPLRSGGLLHHLNEHLLARFQQLSDPCSTFFEAQRAQVAHMDEPIFLTLTDVHKGGVNPGEHVLHRSEINVTDLIATLRNDQLIDTVIGQNCRDAQLFGDDDLLGHKQELTTPVRTDADQWTVGPIARG